jgi:hypothetical protein
MGQLTPPVSRSRGGLIVDRADLVVGELSIDMVYPYLLYATSRTHSARTRRRGSTSASSMATMAARRSGLPVLCQPRPWQGEQSCAAALRCQDECEVGESREEEKAEGLWPRRPSTAVMADAEERNAQLGFTSA